MCYVDAILACLHYVQFGRTALYCASRNGHFEVVQLLLQWNANVNICDEVCTCTYTVQNYDLMGTCGLFIFALRFQLLVVAYSVLL